MSSRTETQVSENANEQAAYDSSDVSTNNWEKLGQEVMSEYTFAKKEDLHAAMGRLAMAVSDGDVSASDVEEFRTEFYEFQRIVESHLVPIVDGVEPYEKVAMNLNYGQREQLLEEPCAYAGCDEPLFGGSDE